VGWETVRLCIVVKTYPVVDDKGEAVCMAGVTDDGRVIRLFPVRFRSFPTYTQFKKFQWFTARIKKSTADPRPESHELDPDSIAAMDANPIPTDNYWAERERIVAPLRADSIESLSAERILTGRSLGLVRPASIEELRIVPTSADWTEAQVNRLRQLSMFTALPKAELKKIDREFRYTWRCADAGCGTHDMKLLDWEVAEAYRSWRRAYGDDWEAKIRKRFDTELRLKFDTSWFVGTFLRYPDRWTLIGWYRPPMQSAPSGYEQLELPMP